MTEVPEKPLLLHDENEPILIRISDIGVFCLPKVPHVHVHYLFSDMEATQLGFTVHEFCCHYCGQASTVFADFNPQNEEDGLTSEDLQVMRTTFDEFKGFHSECPTRQKQGSGADYRKAYFGQLLLGDLAGFCPKVRGVSAVNDIRKNPSKPN